MFGYVFIASLLIGSTSAFQIPHLPKNFQQIAKVTGTAFVGASIYFGAVVPMTDRVSGHESFIANAIESKSIFEGQYNDPNHPGCLRKITAKNNLITIIGSDNIDGSNQWIIQAKEDYPGTIFVDFSPKGGPTDLLGVYDEKDGGIKWPDNNLWTKLKR